MLFNKAPAKSLQVFDAIVDVSYRASMKNGDRIGRYRVNILVWVFCFGAVLGSIEP